MILAKFCDGGALGALELRTNAAISGYSDNATSEDSYSTGHIRELWFISARLVDLA